MPKILVTGANGQLGSELRELHQSFRDFEFHFFTRNDLNIAEAQEVAAAFVTIRPDYCINCAAYTAVDKAESESELAFLINETGTYNLASACKEYNSKFIHISTDYVFDGKGELPYKEDYPTQPLNVYGASKLGGETACMKANAESIIIRTSWVYSSYGNNFVKTMLRLMQSRESLNVVADQKGIPTYAADLAKAIMEIIVSGNWREGIYHYSNPGEAITWFDFAMAIKEKIQSPCQVNPIPSSEYPTPAKRPSYSVLDSEKIRTAFGLQIPHWEASLNQCLSRLKAEAAW